MKKILVLFFLFLLLSPLKVEASLDSASSYILMDMDTKRVLLTKDPHERRLIASITKIMTSVVALESNKLDDIIKVDDSILKATGSGIYIEVGEEITLRDLLYGLMLRSGNDAAIMIARYVSGSEEEFVNKMNEKAKKLGMNNTSFVNSSGLDNGKTGNYSTCYDMALLTSYAMQNEEYRKIVSTKKYVVKTNYKTYIWHNKNKLLSLNYVNGGKTGFTKNARRTLVTTANLNNMNLVVVTLNDPDDWDTHKKLYNYAKENYQSYFVLSKKSFKVVDDLYYDDLYIKDNLYLTLKPKEADKLINKIFLEKKKYYKNDEIVGRSEIYLDNKLLTKINIYVKKKEKLPKKNFFEKVIEWVKSW